MTVVVFNYNTPTTPPAPPPWATMFPELAQTVTQQVATEYFAAACYLCDNTDCGPVPAGAPAYQRDTFLNYITAHLAALFSPIGNAPNASPLVGRISNATEGSVSVEAQLVNNPSDQMAFFMQTKYGLMYWTMSGAYRTGIYVPGPCQPAPGIFGVYNGTPGYLDPWSGGPGYG
jgi:hypothetical protein